MLERGDDDAVGRLYGCCVLSVSGSFVYFRHATGPDTKPKPFMKISCYPLCATPGVGDHVIVLQCVTLHFIFL